MKKLNVERPFTAAWPSHFVAVLAVFLLTGCSGDGDGNGDTGTSATGGTGNADPCAEIICTAPQNGSAVCEDGTCNNSCDSGFMLLAGQCDLIDACADDNGGCGDPAFWTCTTSQEGGATCTDIDECTTDNGGCGNPEFWTCTNNEGGDQTCADLDECAKNNGGCGKKSHWHCKNNPGAAPTCTDIDDCLINNGGCGDPMHWECVNMEDGVVACDEAPCKGILEGSLVLVDPTDKPKIANYCEITGDITINGEDFKKLDFKFLTKVGGSIEITASSLQALYFPELTSVGGNLVLQDNDLWMLSAPILKSVGGHLFVNTGPLESLEIPLLTSIGGQVNINVNEPLTGLFFPQLKSLGSHAYFMSYESDQAFISMPLLKAAGGNLEFFGEFTSFHLPALTTVDGELKFTYNYKADTIALPLLKGITGNLRIHSNSNLKTVEMPELIGVDGDVLVGTQADDMTGGISTPDIVGSGNVGMTSLSFAKLSTIGGAAEILDNTELMNLSLPLLAWVDDGLKVENNSSLAQCLVDGLVTQIKDNGGVGGPVVMSGNNENCSCKNVDDGIEVICM